MKHNSFARQHNRWPRVLVVAMLISLVTLFPNPNHPSYPSAHAMFDGPSGAVLGYLFPRDADYFTALSQEAGSSRLWAGIHFCSDIKAGSEIGRAVGQKVIERAENDGSQQ